MTPHDILVGTVGFVFGMIVMLVLLTVLISVADWYLEDDDTDD